MAWCSTLCEVRYFRVVDIWFWQGCGKGPRDAITIVAILDALWPFSVRTYRFGSQALTRLVTSLKYPR